VISCAHEPGPLYDAPKAAATAILRPYRSQDWRRCAKCGAVGLKSRRSERVRWDPEEDSASVIESAAKWNAWNERLAAEERDEKAGQA
jgi:hypothetical protein